MFQRVLLRTAFAELAREGVGEGDNVAMVLAAAPADSNARKGGLVVVVGEGLGAGYGVTRV